MAKKKKIDTSLEKKKLALKLMEKHDEIEPYKEILKATITFKVNVKLKRDVMTTTPKCMISQVTIVEPDGEMHSLDHVWVQESRHFFPYKKRHYMMTAVATLFIYRGADGEMKAGLKHLKHIKPAKDAKC